MPKLLLAALIAGALASPAEAQHHGHGPQAADSTPYGGFQRREIKALSDQQIADLRAGRGMGLALAAELNGYPGPMHVLELAGQLSLSPEQRDRTSAALAAMSQEAITIGAQVIAAELELDRLFASRTVTQQIMAAAVNEIAAAQARLRALHLGYHLVMATILTPEQAAAYARLRGYGPVRGG